MSFPCDVRGLLALPLLLVAAPVLAQSASTGSGQAYPAKPIRIVVPFSAGSASDILARFIGPKLYEA